MLGSLLSTPRVSLKPMLSVFTFRLATSMIIIALCQGPAWTLASQNQTDLMTNQTIIDLVKAKTSDSLIIALIQQSKATKFDVTAGAILQLKHAGVSDAVIQAMMAKESGQPMSSQAATSSSAAPSGAPVAPAGLPTEIGVYIRKGDQWVEVLPEIVNWKTGGVLKSIATAGIVKGDVNGRIEGPHSRTVVQTPLEFLIVAPEGVAITEYQFLRLRAKKDAREFRTMTGGVVHASSGAKRDLVPFEGKKIAPRVYSVTFTTLDPGEYGFLPPGAFISAGAASHLGKIYTFSLTEKTLN